MKHIVTNAYLSGEVEHGAQGPHRSEEGLVTGFQEAQGNQQDQNWLEQEHSPHVH